MLGLPSLHTLDHAQGARIWFAAEATICDADSIDWRSEYGR